MEEKRISTYKNFSFTISPYELGEKMSFIKLLHITREKNARFHHTDKFWNWKHLQNRFGKSYGSYGWDGNRQNAIGLRMLMRWAFETPGRSKIFAMRAVDTATHPTYQRKGIFSALVQKALSDLAGEEIRFIFNTPNPKTSLQGYLKLGWKIVGHPPLYVRVLKYDRLQKDSFEKKILTWKSFRKKYGDNISYLIKEWETKRAHIGYRTPRDLEYLEWRYGECPHFNYKIFALGNKNELEGFAVLRFVRWRRFKSAGLTDIFINNTNLQVRMHFLKELMRTIQVDHIVANFAKETLEHEMLIEAGFQLKIDKNKVLTVHQLDAVPLNPLDLKNWDFTLGDLEVF